MWIHRFITRSCCQLFSVLVSTAAAINHYNLSGVNNPYSSSCCSPARPHRPGRAALPSADSGEGLSPCPSSSQQLPTVRGPGPFLGLKACGASGDPCPACDSGSLRRQRFSVVKDPGDRIGPGCADRTTPIWSPLPQSRGQSRPRAVNRLTGYGDAVPGIAGASFSRLLGPPGFYRRACPPATPTSRGSVCLPFYLLLFISCSHVFIGCIYSLLLLSVVFCFHLNPCFCRRFGTWSSFDMILSFFSYFLKSVFHLILSLCISCTFNFLIFNSERSALLEFSPASSVGWLVCGGRGGIVG